MALANPVVQPPRVSRKTSTTPPTTPPPRVEDPVRAAARARQRARMIEEQRRNANARRAALAGPPGGVVDDPNGGNTTPPPGGGDDVVTDDLPGGEVVDGAGGLDANGVWTAPTNAYLAGLANGTIAPRWAGAPGSATYQGWLNMRNGGNPIPDGGLPPVTPPPVDDPAPDPSTGQQSRPNRHPNRGNRQNRPGQVSQQAAQALYNDNTIPHDFKGQLMELARSGNVQRFNEALFGSGLPQETKMRLMELFGFGGGAGGGPTGGGGGVVPNPQGVPQTVPSNVGPPVPPNPQGSQYYGLY